MGIKLPSSADIRRAEHTLWQAAVSSGGFLTIADAASSKGVDVNLLEQGAGVVGIAVGAAALSLVKGYLRDLVAARKTAVKK